MGYWKLIVEKFGKIERAEIELAPMTLLVGDNNSGKSYLLSLLWAIYALSGQVVFSYEVVKKLCSKEYDRIEDLFWKKIDNLQEGATATIELQEISGSLQIIINQLLDEKKEELVKVLFHSEVVQIGKLSLRMPELPPERLTLKRDQGNLEIECSHLGNYYVGYWQSEEEQENKEIGSQEIIEEQIIQKNAIRNYISGLLRALIGTGNYRKGRSVIYLPSARTGFMMTKGIIDKFARNNTYGWEGTSEENVSVEAFSRPVMAFLDEIGELSEGEEASEKYQEIVSLLQDMIQGTIVISTLPGKELSYIPHGEGKKYPFRVTSAVATEISPLLLLLAHKKVINGIFYEEPELCLHPALQKRMGQVLIQMVNAGIRLMVTTHSDIVLQHLNNMIHLKSIQANAEEYGYKQVDLIDKNVVRVYQLSNDKVGLTRVESLSCGTNGFVVPTFNEALEQIMEDVVQIQNQ
ncbi:MAG: AAA family ATPase [Lachnospiraceae bacterium]|jgi:predicted ATPase|nr:AAA family ATPase [Lachnospiraceae bacterium]MCX4315551.1 AAA family ATPase [Lachnospiraceae bacterium]